MPDTGPSCQRREDASAQVPQVFGTSDAWAVGYSEQTRGAFYPLGLHWNGTSWSVSTALATTPGASIVQAVGFTGSSQACNPLSLQNG